VESWSPASESDVRELIRKQLPDCTPEQRSYFESISTIRSVPIRRFGLLETVWVVAQSGERAIYYEDIEEGFNISKIAPDGSIATPTCEQWTLRHSLHHFMLK